MDEQQAIEVLAEGLRVHLLFRASPDHQLRSLAERMWDAIDHHALLDALDAVPRDDQTQCGGITVCRSCTETYDGMRARAERAERERDEAHTTIRTLLDGYERMCKALRPFAEHGGKCDYYPHGGCVDHDSLHRMARGGGYQAWDCPYDEARAALSTDADADAEPTPWQTPEDAGRISVENMAERWGPCRPGAMDCGHDSINYSYVLGHCRACDMEHAKPSRAEGDEPDCQTCNDTGALWLGDNEYVCKDCTTPPGAHALVGQPSPSPEREGDDGRSRAIEAALCDLVDRIEGEHDDDCHEGGFIKCPCVWRANDRARAALEGGPDG